MRAGSIDFLPLAGHILGYGMKGGGGERGAYNGDEEGEVGVRWKTVFGDEVGVFGP